MYKKRSSLFDHPHLTPRQTPNPTPGNSMALRSGVLNNRKRSSLPGSISSSSVNLSPDGRHIYNERHGQPLDDIKIIVTNENERNETNKGYTDENRNEKKAERSSLSRASFSVGTPNSPRKSYFNPASCEKLDDIGGVVVKGEVSPLCYSTPESSHEVSRDFPQPPPRFSRLTEHRASAPNIKPFENSPKKMSPNENISISDINKTQLKHQRTTSNPIIAGNIAGTKLRNKDQETTISYDKNKNGLILDAEKLNALLLEAQLNGKISKSRITTEASDLLKKANALADPEPDT